MPRKPRKSKGPAPKKAPALSAFMKRFAEFFGGRKPEDDEDPEGTAGVREPKRPIPPTLAGAAAKELPREYHIE